MSAGLQSENIHENQSENCSVMSNSLQPHGLRPPRLLCPWDSPGKNTGVGCRALLQGIFPTPWIKPRYPALQADSLLSDLPGKPENIRGFTNKASGGDGIPVELFQILKDVAVKVLHSICQQICKTQQWPQDWFFQ